MSGGAANYKEESRMSDVCICPERPELFAGLPIGQYHCGACGCMVLGGVEHLQHDIGCWLLEYDTDTYETLAASYAAHYAPLFDRSKPPSWLPEERAWVWMGGASPPRWEIRGLGLRLERP